MVYPGRDALEEEMVALLRLNGWRNHRSRPDQSTMLTRDEAPNPNKKAGALWPPYRGPLSRDSNSLGKIQVEPFSKGKYNETGPITPMDMLNRGVDPRFAQTFAKKLNGSYAWNSWKQRGSIVRTIARCGVELGRPLSFPWGSPDLQNFVGWCMEERLKSNTIQQYVSNVRSMHRDLGLVMDESSWPFLSTVLRGHDNLAVPLPSRIPMTPELMFQLKRKLAVSSLSLPLKRLIWVVCCVLLQGSLRVGEVLSATTTQFCKDTTLLGSDVTWSRCKVGGKDVSLLVLKLRKPKETRGSVVVPVELFDLGEGCFYSATQAWGKWRESSSVNIEDDLPVFRRENGALLTPSVLNGVIKSLLAETIQYEDGYVASHSFRSGLVSTMARLGYSDEDIRRQGRWASTAFERYIKLGRAARLEEQWTLASRVSKLVSESLRTGSKIR